MSITLVIIAHAFGTGVLPMNVRVVGVAADVGVRSFFVLSGFLITTLLLRELEREKTISLAGFYVRRAFRIFPAFYTYLLVIGACSLIGMVELLEYDLLAAASYTTNFHAERSWWTGHLWSLAVEEQFYLVWPLAVHALSRRALVRVSVVLVATGPAVRGATAAFLADGRSAYDIGDAVYWFTPSHADAFAAGALVALLGLGDRVTRPALLAALAGAAIAVSGAANLSALRAAGADLPLGTFGFPLASIANNLHLWGYTVLNLAAAALVAAAVAAHRRGGVLSALGWGPVAGLGKISYGIYVLHWPLLVLFNASVRYRPMTLRGALMCAAWFALVVAVAWLSWRFFEAPFLALKDRVPGRAVEPALARAA